jgi:hypothetical protein
LNGCLLQVNFLNQKRQQATHQFIHHILQTRFLAAVVAFAQASITTNSYKNLKINFAIGPNQNQGPKQEASLVI